jgi:hypothetical protein
MRRFVRDNGLSIFFLAAFAVALAGQAFAGWNLFNEQARIDGEETLSLGRFLISSSFGNAVLENWQSEYLQFTLFILVTVWLVQRGSPESKEPGKEGPESEREQQIGEHADERSPLWARLGGPRSKVYSNSLLLLMGVIWLASWYGQSVTGWSDNNRVRAIEDLPGLSWWEYLGTSQFWESTLQNWQSEFLAVGSMAVFAIYLRQRGSPESKPVGAGHAETGTEG